MRKWLFFMVLLIVAGLMFGKVNFASTQMTPAAEREFMLNKLAEFSKKSGIDVEFLNFEYPQLYSRLQAEIRAGKNTLNLIADLQGNLYIMASEGFLSDLKDLKFEGKTFIETLEKFAYVKGEKVFIPWLQATYVMAVNKKAFDYLRAVFRKKTSSGGRRSGLTTLCSSGQRTSMRRRNNPFLASRSDRRDSGTGSSTATSIHPSRERRL